MPTYTYKARNSEGVLTAGELEGKNAIEVKHLLADQGLFPVSVSSKSQSINLGKFLKFKKGVDSKELIALTRQFAALFKAGVTMERILTNLSRQTQNEGLKAALLDIKKDVSAGKSLAEAFGKHPDYFSDLYINMLSIGELGGVLDDTLKKLTDVMKREHRIVSSVKSATLYPKIVIVVFIIVVFVMMIYVIPGFAGFYSSYNSELPLPTRILMAISNTIAKYWYIAAGVMVAMYIGFKKYIATTKGRLVWDRFIFKVPVMGELTHMVVNGRFCHLLGALYRSGLPLSRSLPVVGDTIGNKAFQKEIYKIHEDIEKGSSLADSMAKREFFTPLVIETTSVGESTGALDEMLQETADFYDAEVNDMLERLTTLIEPLLLVGIFAMVALLAFAIFLPMWKLSGVILKS